MVSKLAIDDFLNQILQGVVLDVRTPAEYEKGHLPHALNLALFSNEERVIVGTLYKQKSPEIAFEKGIEIVGPKMVDFIRQAKKYAKGGKPLFLYCWRGGKRSGSMAWLLDMAGFEVYLLEGGYKAYRTAFISLLESHVWKFCVLGGSTGCGKTDILHEMAAQGEQVLDIEGLAKHKGSAFGSYGQGSQPSNEAFYNLLHDTLRQFDPHKIVWCEGESIVIGKVNIPVELFTYLQSAPLILFSLPMEARVSHVVLEYGKLSKQELEEAFLKIEKRIGREQCKEAIHYICIDDLASAARIALNYYDKGYQKSIEKRSGAIILRYNAETDNALESANELRLLVPSLI